VGPQGDFQEDVAELTSSWQVDDNESETRRIAWGDQRTVSVDEPLLEDAVLEEIRRVLAWTEPECRCYPLNQRCASGWSVFPQVVDPRVPEFTG
jgi:hypothetical protein